MFENVIKMLMTPLKQEPSQEISPERAYVTRQIQNSIPQRESYNPITPNNTNLMQRVNPVVTPNQPRNRFADSVNDIQNADIYLDDKGLAHSNNSYVDRIIEIESGRNPSAVSPTNAVGPFQFLESTWNRSNYSGSRDNIHDSLYAYKDFTKGNINYLKKMGVPITPETVYWAHNLGMLGAVNLYNHVNKGEALLDKTESSMKCNVPKGTYVNPQTYIDHISKKFNF